MADVFSVVNAVARGIRRGGSADGQEKPFRLNQNDELLVAQGLPPYTEMARRFPTIQVQTSTLFAPLVGVPTTTAILELWVNASSQDSFVVESLFADQILGTAAAQAFAIYAMVAAKSVPSLTTLTATDVNADGGNYATTVGSPLVSGIGSTVVANGWRPYGMPHGGALAAATPMSSWEARIEGRIIVRPGRALCLHVVGSLATASSFQVGAQGYMVPNELVSRANN